MIGSLYSGSCRNRKNTSSTLCSVLNVCKPWSWRRWICSSASPACSRNSPSSCGKDRPESELPALRAQLGYLNKIIADEVSIKERIVQRLPPKEQGSFRIGSAADPEATYRVHGPDPEDTSFGYNVQAAISNAGFVCETRAYTGADPDQSGVADLVQDQKERQGICPEKLIYDQAAGCGTPWVHPKG